MRQDFSTNKTHTTIKMSLKKIRILQVVFENEIQPWEVAAFRGAVIATAGKQHVLFHNHKDDKFLYSYPLIQYKQVDRKPMLMSIDQGIEEIHHFFEKMQMGIMLGDRQYELKIDKLNMNQFNMQVWDKMWEYRIQNWLALNKENYVKYQSLESMVDKIQQLESTLKGNILSFAKGIDWSIEKEIKLQIKNMQEPRSISYKGNKLTAFNLVFSTNVFLPNFIGLGKGASSGFGVIVKISRNDN